MKQTIATVLLLVYLAVLFFGLFQGSVRDGASRYAALEKAVRSINECNGNLDSAVLALRLGLRTDYDQVTRIEKEFENSIQLGSVGNLPALLGFLVESKVEATADFKAGHAIVRNSEAGFSRHVRKALNQMQDVPTRKRLSELETLGARFVISGNKRDQLHFHEAILRIEKSIASNNHPESGNRSFHLALRHASVLLTRKTDLDETISRLISIPVKARTTAIMDEAALDYLHQSRRAGYFRVTLFVAIVALCGFCFYQFLSLLRHRTMIQNANERLEIRVRERTAELASKARIIETSLSEVFICDSHSHHFCYANEVALQNLGYSLEELRQLTPVDIANGMSSRSLEEMFELLEVGDQQQVLVQTRHVRKDGTEYDVEVRLQQTSYQGTDSILATVIDITDRVAAEARNHELQKELIESSRTAGMAEVATGVLHNVGNVLNSVNISATLIQQRFATSAVDRLDRICGLIRDNQDTFAEYVGSDDRGQKLPGYLLKVNDAILSERAGVDDEVEDLLRNVEHIKRIINTQQLMANSTGVIQPICPHELMQDLFAATQDLTGSQRIVVKKDLEEAPPTFLSDKHRVLQILINLVNNARDALLECQVQNPFIVIEVAAGDGRTVITVRDNGIGISEDNIDKIFRHGFSTKKNGHGFGLHSSANAAAELNGDLTVSSSGIGQGATFTLALSDRSTNTARSQFTDVYA